MHADFVTAFKKMKQEYDSGNGSLMVLLKINRAVSDWLKNHIMIHDKEFATYYKNLPK
jgi:hemerythrin